MCALDVIQLTRVSGAPSARIYACLNVSVVAFTRRRLCAIVAVRLVASKYKKKVRTKDDISGAVVSVRFSSGMHSRKFLHRDFVFYLHLDF